MISHLDGSFQHPKPSDSLPNPAPRTYEVMVPVFIKVSLIAQDPLQAEELAVTAARAMADQHNVVGEFTLHFHSIITPIVK